jgi:RimJ/RimL family protein N-acetyltransferase
VFDVAVHGRGVGSTALAAVASYAVRELGTATIIAGIDRNNVASRKAFAAAGFGCVVDDPGAEGFIWHYP